MEVEFAAVIFGGGVPDAEGVVFAAGEEVVGTGVESEGGHGLGVAFEVAEVGVVVGGEVADCVCDENQEDV